MVNLLLVCNCGTLSIFQRVLPQATISAILSSGGKEKPPEGVLSGAHFHRAAGTRSSARRRGHRGNALSMVAKERLPSLRGRAPPPRHILGHAGLADVHAELEKLSMEARRSPKTGWRCSSRDQPANFPRYRRSTAAVPRFPAPIQSETGTTPTDHGVRLHNRQRLHGIRRQTIQPNKDQALHDTEGQSLRLVPSLDVKLMTKDQDLSFQRDPATETIRPVPTRQCCKLLS
jgi:hypothetical protein